MRRRFLAVLLILGMLLMAVIPWKEVLSNSSAAVPSTPVDSSPVTSVLTVGVPGSADKDRDQIEDSLSSAAISFVQGNDWPIGSTMGGNSTWVSLALKAIPNATLYYDQPLNITNTDSTSHTFRLRHISITPASGTSSVGYFTFFNFVVENTAGNQQATFNYTTTGNTWMTPSSTSYLTLPANTQWIIFVETRAAAGANAATANLQIAIDVQQ